MTSFFVSANFLSKGLNILWRDNLSDSSVNFTALRDEILSDFTILPQENGDVSNVVFMITSSLVK